MELLPDSAAAEPLAAPEDPAPTRREVAPLLRHVFSAVNAEHEATEAAERLLGRMARAADAWAQHVNTSPEP